MPVDVAELADSHNLAVTDNKAARRFELRANGELAAFVTYGVERHKAYAFMHTQTLAPFAGHGLASALIGEVLTRMREDGFDVLPYCPFVNHYIRVHPEFVDLVPEAERERFGVTSS